jgi:vancomycin aglycone glucosyltransferase
MKIACFILGTRGDVQPMVALATGLIKHGHEVLVCAPPEHEELVQKNGCRFEPYGINIKKAMKDKPEEQKGGLVIKFTPALAKKIIEDQINLLPEKIRGVDLILAAGIVMAAQSAADILKIPYRLVAFYPILLGTAKTDPLPNRMLFSFGKNFMNLLMKGLVNKNRAKFGLPPVKDLWIHWLGQNVIVACDKELNEVKSGVRYAFTQTGFMILPSKNSLPSYVEDFLNSGKPPVYIGFGSNPIRNPGKYSNMFEQVRKITNQRLIISKGWAELPASDSSDILYVDEMPFEYLFPRMAAVIYHGGTGTMAAIARAGVPQAAFPFMADQFDNRKQVIKLGLGPKTCYFKKITAEAVSKAITECISDDKYKKNALELSEKLRDVNGVELTIKELENEFVGLKTRFE